MNGAIDPTSCPAGRFGSEAGREDAQCSGPCARGHYCEASSTNATAASCAAGRFNPSEGMGSNTSCLLCPKGKFCVDGASSAEECPEHSFGATEGLPSRACSGECNRATQRCPPGTVRPIPDECAAGTYKHDDEEVCVACWSGHFCPSGVEVPTPCPAGRFGREHNLTDAFCSGPCAPGHYCEAGSTNATAASCEAGRFNPSAGMSSVDACIITPLGHYSREGDDQKRLCPRWSLRHAGAASNAGVRRTVRPRILLSGRLHEQQGRRMLRGDLSHRARSGQPFRLQNL